MQLESQKYLYDIQRARSRRGVELAKIDEQTAAKISGYRQIIAFRKILIHGYANVDQQLVWGVVEEKLSLLVREIRELLGSEDRNSANTAKLRSSETAGWTTRRQT